MSVLRLLGLTIAALLLGACATTRPAPKGGFLGLWRPNRFDRRGLAHGRWRTYYDAANTQPYTAGRFRHGRAVGTYRYFAPNGVLDHSEEYARAGACVVTYWYPNGQVARHGPAQWNTGAKGVRFYWLGPWVSFGERGDTTALEQYIDGKQLSRLVYQNGRRATLETYDTSGRLLSLKKLP